MSKRKRIKPKKTSHFLKINPDFLKNDFPEFKKVVINVDNNDTEFLKNFWWLSELDPNNIFNNVIK